jgi:hypothetical protein
MTMPELAAALAAATGEKADPASLSRWLIRAGYRFKTYGPPRLQVGFRDRLLFSLRQRIRPRGASSGHDGDTHAPVLIKLPASDRRFLNQVSGAPFDCQVIPLLPSRKPLLTDGRFERDRPNSMPLPAFL